MEVVVVVVKELTETRLYNKLKTGYVDRDAIMAGKVVPIVERLCEKASNKMKKSLSQHREYTLHDEVHLVRVTELMAIILGEDGLDVLNPIEVMLLILSAYYHDIGMVLSDDDIDELEKNQEYLLFRDNWKANHPAYKETMLQMRNSKNDVNVERCANILSMFNSAILTEYIRINHGELAKTSIELEAASSELWEIEGVSFASILSKISASHTTSVSDISNLNNYPVDERYLSYNVNIQYLCILLRLADILDFDKERTPDELYKSINFSNTISVQEWEKHRSIIGWEISNSIIRFTAHCTHPAYQRTIYRFMDYIEDELVKCHDLVRDFPERAKQYKLNLPVRVDRTRIIAKDNSYIYHDLEISVSRDEIVKLLMMDELYGSQSLCVRELLQNSLDALKYRKNLFKSEGIDWKEGCVKFRQFIDEYGRINLECQDNGIGMDEGIVDSYLTKAGRSYYKSPEFEQIRLWLKNKGIEFNPCSQFGIGFMSCFMLGNEIHIHTRRDYGSGKDYGKPLIVEMNGISGILLIREGEEEQPVGTTIRIIGQEKPRYFDEWVDRTWLIETLDGYALECDFPIEAKCEIEEIKGEYVISPNTLFNRTALEIGKLKDDLIIYEYDLQNTHENMRGRMRISFLKGKDGKISLENDTAKIEKDTQYEHFVVNYDGNKIGLDTEYLSSVCCDGILVCGAPGRDRNRFGVRRLGMRANLFHLGNISYVADIRGDLKPKLTPARVPSERIHNMHPSWKRVGHYLEKASGRLWEKVFSDLESQEEIMTGMILATIYGFRFEYLPENIIYDKLYVPILEAGKMTWKKLRDIEKVEIRGEEWILNETQMIQVDETISKYDIKSRCRSLKNSVISAMKKISYWGVEDEKVYLYIKKECEICNIQETNIYSESIIGIGLANYVHNMNSYISIQTKYRTVNKSHPLINYFIPEMYNEELSPIASFVKSLMFFVTDESNIKSISVGKKEKLQKRLGCCYLDVDWKNYPIECSDNYKIWTKEYGDVIITKEMLIEWSEYRYSEIVDDYD